MVDSTVNIELGRKLAEQARHATVLDNVSQRVCQVYAAALYQASAGKNLVDAVAEELDELGDLFDANPKLISLFASPVVSRPDKSKALNNIFSTKVSQLVLNFLSVVNEHERLELLAGIIRAFRSLVAQRKGLVSVIVTSACGLSQDQMDSLAILVEKKIGRRPLLQFVVDESILGGLIIRAGDWLWDGSLLNQYRVIRGQLIERSTYEIQSRRNSIGN